MRNFTQWALAAALSLVAAALPLQLASAADCEGVECPVVRLGPSKCYKLKYKEQFHRRIDNTPAGSVTGCSGCFYGYDSGGKVALHIPVPCGTR